MLLLVLVSLVNICTHYHKVWPGSFTLGAPRSPGTTVIQKSDPGAWGS